MKSLIITAVLLLTLSSAAWAATKSGIPIEARDLSKQIGFMAQVARRCDMALSQLGLVAYTQHACQEFLRLVPQALDHIDQFMALAWQAHASGTFGRREWAPLVDQVGADWETIHQTSSHLKFLSR
jgi:hypothetical protein